MLYFPDIARFNKTRNHVYLAIWLSLFWEMIYHGFYHVIISRYMGAHVTWGVGIENPDGGVYDPIILYFLNKSANIITYCFSNTCCVYCHYIGLIYCSNIHKRFFQVCQSAKNSCSFMEAACGCDRRFPV